MWIKQIMKILIGVCGIGYGHSTRQLELAKKLIQRGHEVRVLTHDKGHEIFDNRYCSYDIWIPFISYKNGKLNIIDIIKKNFDKFIIGFLKDFSVFIELNKDKFIPDIIISDYDPISARFSYIWNKPLFIVDQQSKFQYFNFEDINGYSCLEEKKRLNLFFPKFSKKFITSFYKLPSLNHKNVEIVGSIIRSDLLNELNKNKKKLMIRLQF